MIHSVKSCRDCPMLSYNWYRYSGTCKHPSSKQESKSYSEFKDDSVQSDCPLKTIDLILTIRQ